MRAATALRLLVGASLPLALWACASAPPEGRPLVHRVTLHGVHAVRPSDLRNRLSVEATSWVPFSPKKYLEPFAVDLDKERIVAFYHARGYFSAKVTSAEIHARKHRQVDVVFNIEEGAATRIASVSAAGFASGEERIRRRAAELGDRLTLEPGQVFDHGRYIDEKDRLTLGLRRLGFAWAEVHGRVEVDRDALTARVRLEALPGPETTLGQIEVVGTGRIDPRLVLRRAALRTGERFSPDTLDAARGRINEVGVFSVVRLDYQRDPARNEVANVKIIVRPGQLNELRLGGGFGAESQRTDVHVALQYVRRSFLGGLRTLRLRLEGGYVVIPAFWRADRQGPAISTDVQLTQPDLFWRGLQLKARVGYELGIEYAYQFHGPALQLGVSHAFWSSHVQIGLSYNFQFLDFFNTDPTILADPAQAGQLFGFTDPYRLGWWQEEAALDLRDRPLDTHQGLYAALTVEEGGAAAGGAFTYQKLLPDGRFYLPLGPRVTLAGRAQFGQLWPEGALGSPITRRFYLGGPNSHRGFNYDRLSPQVPSGLPGVPPIPIGGDQMFLAQTELRVDLVRLYGSWLSTAAFLDAGDVSAPRCGPPACPAATAALPAAFDFWDLHYAVGGGLRYKTLLGTLRFDVGVRLNRTTAFQPDGAPNPDPGQRVAFHLSLGEAF
jgi:outer membrane protein assembly factor BamA